MTNRKFGDLTVISFVGSRNRIDYFQCRCVCGKEIISDKYQLLKGRSNCGCKRIWKKKHNGRGTRLYGIWKTMKNRCYNQNAPKYKMYGERGISVCTEWKDDFTKFRDWSFKNGYAENLTIDRIDNNKGYSPENCRWVSAKVQANNTRRNHCITYKGIVHTMAEWGELLNIPYYVLQDRIVKHKWDIERAFTQKIRKSNKNPCIVPNKF